MRSCDVDGIEEGNYATLTQMICGFQDPPFGFHGVHSSLSEQFVKSRLDSSKSYTHKDTQSVSR